VQAAALEYGTSGVRVNAVLPGTVNTELARRQSGAEALPEAAWDVATGRWARTQVPGVQRVAEPEEIAAFAVDVASDRCASLTGAALPIDGGTSASLP